MVATRDIDSYAHITKSIFDDYKINYFLDDKISAQSNPVLVFILSILDMKNTNYSYKSMFTYLKSGILDLDGDDIALLENYVLANGIRGKKWFEDRWDLPVVHSVEDNPVDIEVQDRINKIKDLVMEPIIRLNEKLKGKNTLRDISSYLYEFTLDIGLDKKIVDLVETFEREEDNYRAREYSQAWNIFVDVLDEMVEFMGDEVIGIE
ncbi:MAG: PD-(D/E)XK nuclease family protein, partial [Peptostreptococcus anaerobius]